ncbi:hypothetical protein [Thiobacillus denitrificans]|uniref:hypothetical protein n=1 Tax=Thiobacillus denitrificans TaxID=36861 RepID=UPI000379F102|nr:hypothetical protein [Thiobacillus denitrificans]
MSRGHSIYHYGTKADYELVIADVAAQFAVKYAVDEWRLEPDHRVYTSPLDAPDFDLFKWGWSPGTMFIVLPEDAALPFSHMPHRQVPEKYGIIPSSVDENYRWIGFHPSGLHKSEQWGEGLLGGWLATNSEHPDSLAIFNAFKKSIKKRFEYFRFSGVYVGPEAVKYFEAGGRLTGDLRSPREGDVKREPPPASNIA